ncbi:helix-turn-helix domain-containing protein [Winogradskyella sp. 3972H.M.0a.05]|uniref:helix-turn-helix domain-containing protein n=1 Tax=Winogradskyella sp. 3972H.M.0a.05 TaxID=2950277 RepID=UPI003391E14E
MTFNVYSILIIAGIIQGLIFTIIVPFTKKYQARSTYFLVALLFSYSFSNFQYVIPYIGLMPLLDMYAYIFLPVAWFVPPTMYLFVVFFLYPERNIKLKDKLLYLPFLILAIIALIFRARVLLGYDTIDPINPIYRIVVVYQEFLAIFYNITVLILTFIMIYKYEKRHNQFNKNHVRRDLKWLKLTLALILFFTLLWSVLVIRNTFINNETNFDNLWLGMTALIYWFGHVGVYKYGILSDRIKIRKYNLKIANDKITIPTKNSIILKFEKLMKDEKAFLDSNLTLDDVAQKLQISTAHLSRSLNNELNISFTDYVNMLRVEEAKSYLTNSAFNNYTIVAIGLEAGFNSRSSFFNVFKKFTNQTPSAFRRNSK